jgi:hypothetical protein
MAGGEPAKFLKSELVVREDPRLGRGRNLGSTLRGPFNASDHRDLIDAGIEGCGGGEVLVA